MARNVFAGLIILPQTAWAHVGVQADTAPFLEGLIHPILNPAHLLAMLTIGACAGVLDGGARWGFLASSLGATTLGGMVGFLQALPEPITVVAVLVFCLAAFTLVTRSPLTLLCFVGALLGAAHGYTHGLETPKLGGPLFGAGLLLAIFLLQGNGLLLGFALGQTRPAATGALAALACLSGLLVIVG